MVHYEVGGAAEGHLTDGPFRVIGEDGGQQADAEEILHRKQ